MSTTDHPPLTLVRASPPLRKGLLRRLPVDLVLGMTLLLAAVVGRSCMEPEEVTDSRPYLGTWVATEPTVAGPLVIAADHSASLGGAAGTWRLVKPVPTRIPPPPSLAVELPEHRTLFLWTEEEELVSSTGSASIHWKRSH